jgi:hypothetical protein
MYYPDVHRNLHFSSQCSMYNSEYRVIIIAIILIEDDPEKHVSLIHVSPWIMIATE